MDPTTKAIEVAASARDQLIEAIKGAGASPNNCGGIILSFSTGDFDFEIEVMRDGFTELTIYRGGLIVVGDEFVVDLKGRDRAPS